MYDRFVRKAKKYSQSAVNFNLDLESDKSELIQIQTLQDESIGKLIRIKACIKKRFKKYVVEESKEDEIMLSYN